MFCFTLTQTENNSSFCFFFTDYAVFFNNTTLRLSARARDITIKKLNSFFWHFLINLPIRSTSDVFSARGAEKTSTRLPLCIRREVLYTFAAWLHVVEKLSNRRKQRKKIMIDKVSKQQNFRNIVLRPRNPTKLFLFPEIYPILGIWTRDSWEGKIKTSVTKSLSTFSPHIQSCGFANV